MYEEVFQTIQLKDWLKLATKVTFLLLFFLSLFDCGFAEEEFHLGAKILMLMLYNNRLDH